MIAQERANWKRLSGQSESTVTATVTGYQPSAENLCQFIYGEYAMNFFLNFPTFRGLKPQGSLKKNEVEFARLALFFEKLAEDHEYVDRLIEEVEKDANG
jgi:hypothetical protein